MSAPLAREATEALDKFESLPLRLRRAALGDQDVRAIVEASERMKVTEQVQRWSARHQADLIRVIAEQFHGTDASDAIYDAAEAIDRELLREDRERYGGHVGDESGWKRSAMGDA